MRTSIERWRKRVTTFVTVFWLMAASVIDSRWGEDSPIGLTLLVLGYALTGVGAIGRVWCLSYIAGHKTADLVTAGPYSLCRNPLYFFSVLGAIGVGLGSSTMSFPLLVMVGFVAYYPFMLKAEANKLAAIHAETYQAYRQTTPALLPSLKHFHESNEQLINSRAFRRGLFDTFWFFATLALMHVFAELHHSGVLPVWYVLP